ncbi:rhodanese-like domain-containing protein [Formosa algae]|uniref:Rhodanese-related sulfurtransferase n=1 Tax=Formosa algae TaxID=225843 RepID=A0A9X1CAI5_9FLAO|nr:rhodanese-like domain-containing protein [Formosa algae]MBP1838129.1 rhodanese-related sulfurtransferase [Formosa algae]MDQ0334264.1 rhodanese-related sulfurtransferase [Formosa algae]OEI80089.1 sulfurtransferase [Formosa algae]PNW29846.1 sulfurtransferase [Formosa algae]
MGLLDFLFRKQKRDIEDFKSRGAIILDVRTKKEYKNGHIIGSENIPIDDLQQKVTTLKTTQKPFIVCCASGVRSAKAVKYLLINGIEATNGGSYRTLKKLL